MHANTASVSSKNNQIAMAFANAKASNLSMRQEHGDKSFAVRDTLLGMLNKAQDKRTVTISPGIARRIVQEANFPAQRKITDDRLYDAKRSIDDGSWNPYHTIHFVKLADGAFWLVNGQTRLTAISECGKAMKIGVIVQDVEDEHEARAVYTQFDRQAAVRTNNQILNAAGVSDDFGLPRQLATYLFSAVGIINNCMVPPVGSSKDERAIESRNTANKLKWVGEWSKEALQYAEDITHAQPNRRRALMRSGTMAVALVTYRYQAAKAKDFWRRVADGADLKVNDPRKTLYDDLADRNMRLEGAGQSIQQSALAWNAYMEGRSMKIVRVAPQWHLKIVGTPYGKGIK